MIDITKVYIYFVLSIILSSQAFAQFELKKIKEFNVSTLNDLDILDYFPSKKIFLGFLKTPNGNDIVIINERGGIIVQKNLVGEGPDQSVSSINNMAFSKEGDVWIQSAIEVLLYDEKLILKEKISYPSSLTIQIFGRKEYFPYFFNNGLKSGFSFVTIPSGTNSFSTDNQLNKGLIEIYTPTQDKLFKIALASDRGIYKRLSNSLISSLYFIVYRIDNVKQKLFLTTRLDDEIIVYNLTSYQLESRLKIKHGDFKVLKNNSISLQDLPSVNRVSTGAKNNQIFLLDEDLIILNYVKEIPQGIYMQKKSIDQQYHHYNDPSYHRLILFDQNKQLSGDMLLPKNGHLMTSLPGNKLLFKIVDPDLELDHIRFEVYQVVKN